MPLESLSTSSLFLLCTDKHPAIYSTLGCITARASKHHVHVHTTQIMGVGTPLQLWFNELLATTVESGGGNTTSSD